MRPALTDNLSLITSLLKDLEIVGMNNKYARELDTILRNPHMRVNNIKNEINFDFTLVN